MYVCQICGAISKPRQPRLTYAIYRQTVGPTGGARRDVSRELAVCQLCKAELDAGGSLDEVARRRAPKLREYRQAEFSREFKAPPDRRWVPAEDLPPAPPTPAPVAPNRPVAAGRSLPMSRPGNGRPA